MVRNCCTVDSVLLIVLHQPLLVAVFFPLDSRVSAASNPFGAGRSSIPLQHNVREYTVDPWISVFVRFEAAAHRVCSNFSSRPNRNEANRATGISRSRLSQIERDERDRQKVKQEIET